jgi:hypothetical protein
LNELARHDKAIAALLPFLQKDRDGQFEIFESIFERFDHTHACVLHQENAWNSNCSVESLSISRICSA